jgi:hypothetical protein
LSTTFEVFPKSRKVPSFGELLDLSSKRLNEFLRVHGISQRPEVGVVLRNNQPDDVALPVALAAEAAWPDSQYAWFFVPTITGGTDAYFLQVDKDCEEYWEEEIKLNEFIAARAAMVAECLRPGHHWRFRRSAGQPAIINVAYGLIAASLAELTEGMIHSFDNAWDYKRFPATASEFYSWYFKPEQAIEQSMREWSQRCIRALPSDLNKVEQSNKPTVD